jgi:hypothetical protein
LDADYAFQPALLMPYTCTKRQQTKPPKTMLAKKNGNPARIFPMDKLSNIFF